MGGLGTEMGKSTAVSLWVSVMEAPCACNGLATMDRLLPPASRHVVRNELKSGRLLAVGDCQSHAGDAAGSVSAGGVVRKVGPIAAPCTGNCAGVLGVLAK